MKVARVNGRTFSVQDSALGPGGTAAFPTLSSLPDVDISTLDDGDVLIWDQTTVTWVPGSSSGGGPGFLTTTGGGKGTVATLGSLGSTETIDVSAANYFTGTLNAACTIGFTGWTSGKDSAITVELTENGTGGWTPTFTGVDWLGGTTPTHDTTAGSTTLYVFMSRDGGTTIYGGQLGGGGGSALTIEDEGTPLTTAATSIDFVGAGVTASGATAAKTVTIPGGATASDTGIWRPVMDSGSGMVIVDGATGEAIMGFGPA